MTRNQKTALFLSLAIVGGAGIGVLSIPVLGLVHGAAPGTARVVAATLVVILAMAWACYFATRAHLAQDEFARQREISASYWGGWLGIAASAPVFFFIGIGAVVNRAAMHAPPVLIFTTGYLLAPLCGLAGAVGGRIWLRYRDR